LVRFYYEHPKVMFQYGNMVTFLEYRYVST